MQLHRPRDRAAARVACAVSKGRVSNDCSACLMFVRSGSTARRLVCCQAGGRAGACVRPAGGRRPQPQPSLFKTLVAVNASKPTSEAGRQVVPAGLC
jgi:hypothetical protein